ncbi:MAG: DAK2 domain-containing protein [Bacilli bacterium]|nr:DAK2 domain-containing protein [Bacilli bacterium]
MGLQTIDKETWVNMVTMGANFLAQQREAINNLNVFPVPDGDTGTNMNLSMSSGLNEMNKLSSDALTDYVHAFSKGLLMGARGNSGVILSQLFRGFSQFQYETNEINLKDFANALSKGVEIAYQSVTNPQEGTILTVAKDMANKALEEAKKSNQFIPFMEEIVKEGKRSLERTPELLPILKEVGVVDSGGKGLVVIYEGFLAALKGEKIDAPLEVDVAVQMEQEVEKAHQTALSAESIQYGYCTEFFVKLNTNDFDEAQFRQQLSEYGDSLLVASSDELVKIHIHTEQPGVVLTLAQQYGELVNIDIENMREQHRFIVEKESEKEAEADADASAGKYAIITVAQGDGLKKMLKSIGATFIIDGGQTMNPSTEDFLRTIDTVKSEHIIILPNNKNILLAANQAKQLTEKDVSVIPTKTIPQGIQALLEFNEEYDRETNVENMTEAAKDVKTGLVTYATRDTKVDGLEVKQNDFIGLNDETILVADKSKLNALKSLVEKLIDEDDEMVTIFAGEDVNDEEMDEVEQFFEMSFPDVEVEVHEGNQPIYSFIVMVE